MTLFEKVNRFLAPYQSNLGAVFLSILKFACWTAYALFSVYLIRESVRLFTVHDMAGLEGLLYEFLAFTGIYFLVTWSIRTADWPVLYHDMDRWIYGRYLHQIMRIESTHLEKLGTGRLIAILTTGTKVWIEGLTNLLKEGTKIIIVLGFILYLFFSKSIAYGAIFSATFIVLHILIVYADGFAHRHRRVRSERKSEFTRQLVRIFMSRNELLQSGAADREIDRSMDIIEEVRTANHGINRALFVIFNLVRAMTTLSKAGILAFIIYGGMDGFLAPADVAALLSLFIVFEGFLVDSVEFYKNFTKDFSDIEKIWETFDQAPKNIRYSHGSTFHFQKGDFALENVSFSYNTKEADVFRDFSLLIRGGQKTALVGHSGSGKTTLIKMLAGYIEPTSGSIHIDGMDFSKIALKTYYPHIGYLTQEPGVFDATIRENLVSALGKEQKDINHRKQSTKDRKESNTSNELKPNESTTEERLIQALKLAQCDFVFELEKGLDTEIGERGVRLSGGQKQRLAIAKIFLKDPEIILLDEPTSALDSFSEEAITEALHTLFEGRTVIIVAHRLQTVKKADDIIVLEHGTIQERGKHVELVERGGIYAKMLELQSGF